MPILCLRRVFHLAIPCLLFVLRGEADADDYRNHVFPILSTYCFECHDESSSKGDLTLDGFNTERDALQAPREIWEKVEQHVMLHVMPPADAEAPSIAQRNTVLKWLQETALSCDCSKPLPGSVTIRRLNRTEYDNTIRDLFGWPIGHQFHPSADFPLDDTGYGFDNIGDVLTIPPTMLQKYLRAADQVLSRAIVSRLPGSTTTRIPLEEIDGGVMTGGLKLLKRDRLEFEYAFPHPGDYEVEFTAFSLKAGNEEARTRLSVGRLELGDFEVRGTRESPMRLIRRFRLRNAGTHKVSFKLLNDWDDPDAQDPNRRLRAILVSRAMISGPFAPDPPSLSPSHRKYFGDQWVGRTPYRSNEVRARDIIEKFAAAAFRRPPNQRELDELQKLYWLGDREGETFEGAVRLAMQAVLTSPRFLFRGEPVPSESTEPPNSVSPIDEYALASRLSYFLWSSMPDESLLQHASNGTLRAHLSKEIDRMIKDPKSIALTDNFAGQWLQIRDIGIVQPDQKTFPTFNESLRASMREETSRFFQHIVREDRSVLEFLTADYSFLNDRLASHYGIKGVSGPEFRMVSLDGSPRRGVLTHGSFLTLTSNPNRTSPVLRGKWILENILGTPPPAAPQDVPPIEREEVAALDASFRKRMELHRQEPRCAGCHFAMDAVGFAFEHYDAIGSWRADDQGDSIESAGSLLTGERFENALDLSLVIANDRREEFLRCFTERLLTYAIGRGPEFTDQCAIDEILKKAEANNYRFSSFLLGVIECAPFQMRGGAIANSSDIE